MHREPSGRRSREGEAEDWPTAEALAALAEAGGSFDWLAEEPDLYSDADGEPVSPDDSELHAGSTTSQPTSEIGVTGGAQLLDPGRPQRKNGDL